MLIATLGLYNYSFYGNGMKIKVLLQVELSEMGDLFLDTCHISTHQPLWHMRRRMNKMETFINEFHKRFLHVLTYEW